MDELKKIKKLYGEKFAKLCGERFPTILNTPGMLLEILQEHFYPSRTLYEDIIREDKVDEFVMFITVFYNEKMERAGESILVERDEKPEELMAMVGYKLYKCETVEDVMSFVRYYAPDEELCTFKDAKGRLDRCVIFFAVREDADTVQRGNPPKRQDAYGTSVISLQFAKKTGAISIKNRYNHGIREEGKNPDATFDNNLEQIIPGLTSSFNKHYQLNVKVPSAQNASFFLRDGVVDVDGVHYKSNVEINGIDYCEDNIVIRGDGVAIQYPKDKYELIDHFLYNKQTETIEDLSVQGIEGAKPDSFVSTFANVEKVDIIKGKNGERTFFVTDKKGNVAQIVVDKSNRIISYSNPALDYIPDDFLKKCEHIKSLNLPNVEEIGISCFCRVYDLLELDVPQLKKMGGYCFQSCDKLEKIELDNLEEMGDGCFSSMPLLKELSLDSLKSMGTNCFKSVDSLEKLYLPNLEKMGDVCFSYAESLREVILPKLTEMHACFTLKNNIEKISLDSLELMGEGCFCESLVLKQLYLPNLRVMGDRCFQNNVNIENLSMDKLVSMGRFCFDKNLMLKSLSLPSLKTMGECCFTANTSIERLEMGLLEDMGANCFKHNDALKDAEFPSLQSVGVSAFKNNGRIRGIIEEIIERYI